MNNFKNNKYVIREPKYQASMPAHDGEVIGPGYPVIMGSGILPEAKAWACPVMAYGTEESARMIESGKMSHAGSHIHEYDECYLFLGEEGAVTYEITLGTDVYTVGTPSAVWIPARLPHGFRVLSHAEGKFGGMCPICFSREYATKPVPENPLVLEDTRHLIVEGYQWASNIPSHNEGIGGKGFPMLMSGDLVPEAKCWICPTLLENTPELCLAINSGMSPAAKPHTHTDDEMYLILGEENASVIRIQLDDEFYTVVPPAAVYVPAGVVHSIEAVYATPQKWGGSCAVFLGKDYITYPTEK